MADPSSEEDGLLREWAPMTGLLQQIPLKAQRGIFTYDLSLTCVDALPDYIAVGTNLGLVYWYSRRKGDLQRLRCENTASAITCVKVISTVDYMVAAGSDQGVVTVFQIPKALPDCLPENMKPKRNKQVERYTISKLHTTAVTAIEWSLNGMKLFSGDKNGLVVLTEIDFYMHLSKSVELLNEKYEIVQLSYSQQLLLVSTLYRSIVCHRVDRWRVAQVGQKERKLLGRLGATFCQGSGRPHELVVYASRPGLRMWLADKNGIVQQTLIFKDTMLADHTTVPLINPAPAHVKQSCNEHQWGPLLVFKENLLLSYSSDMVYVVDPNDISVVAVVADLRRVVDVAVTKDEIFILEGDRSLVRIAHLPESAVVTVSDLPGVDDDEANALVTLVSSPLVQSMLIDNGMRKKSVWCHVAAEMARSGYSVGENAGSKCREKWLDILEYYRATEAMDKHPRPAYFDILDRIANKNPLLENEVDEHRALKLKQRRTSTVLCSTFLTTALPSNKPSVPSSSCVKHAPVITLSPTRSERDDESKQENCAEKFIVVHPQDLNNSTLCSSLEPAVGGGSDAVEHIFVSGSPENALPSSSWSCKSLQLGHAKCEQQSKARPCNTHEVIVTMSPNQALRPVPTATEALLTVLGRMDRAEKQREQTWCKKTEERLQQMETLISKQSDRSEQLLQVAADCVGELIEECLKPEQYPDGTFMSIPVSLSDMSVASSLIGFTSKIKESAVVPSIPFLFNRANVGKEQDGWNVVVVADEAVELPPIVPIPTSSLTGLTVGKEVTIATADGMASTTDENKVYKEVYNRSQRGSAGSRRGSSYSHDSSRTEVLEKIGEQQFEDVVFKPKPKKKKKKKTVKSKHLMSGTESGSDTMSTNSVRSNTSDCEDPWSSERLAASSDWSSMSTWPSSGTNGGHAPGRSSSEETLVRLGDSIISEPGALPSDDCGSVDSPAVHERDGRPPDELPLSADNNHIPTSVKPDLRSPATIERDVAAKEWLLAAVFNLDPLHVDEAANAKAEKVSQPSTESCSPTAESVPLGIVCESSANEANFNPCDDGILGCQEDRLGSLGSTLSYGPPSGSSAPPSVPASLELCQSEDTCETDTFQIFQSVDRSDCWVQYRTPDGVVGLSVCQHYVCCIDSRDALHYSSVDGLGLKWKKVDDRAEQVALSPSGALVWKLRKGTAYALQNPSQKGPFGEEWVKAACDVQSIAVDVATAWFVSLESQIYVQKKLTADKPCSTSVPVFCVLPATKVSCFNGSVWILTSNGKVLYRSGISSSVPEGKEWKEVSVPFPVMDISLGCQGTGWVVEAKNVVHFTKDFTVEDPQWWQILISDCIFQPTTSLQHLCTKLTDSYLKNLRQSSSIIMAAADNTMWMSERMANNVHVNKTEFTGHQWNRIHLPHLHPGFKWHKVTAGGICGDKGCLWLLSEAGDFFCSEPSLGILQTLPLPENIPFICISATPQAVWVLSVKGSIYVYQLMDTKSHSVNGVGVWNKINLTQLGGIRLVHLSCNSDYAWACSDQGEVYMTIGSPRSMISSTFAPAWIPVDEQPDYKVCFTKVYMGPEGFMVWALDKKRNVFVRTSIVPEYPLGRGWSLVSGIEAVELTISGTAVWALSPGGSVYRRYGITQNHCTGDYWKKIPGCVESLTASVNDELWALDRKSLLLLHSQVAVTLCANNTGNELTSILNVSLDSDWEHIDKE